MADSAFLALIGINKFRVFSRLILFDPLLRHQNDHRSTGASRNSFQREYAVRPFSFLIAMLQPGSHGWLVPTAHRRRTEKRR